ncbi:ABC transporter substrate-binding protein [Candidatus Bipolaricaulota bacterium]|nr:ABC transporter substrate-binding protein [Candidatus Bipolaricaulota bacterium]
MLKRSFLRFLAAGLLLFLLTGLLVGANQEQPKIGGTLVLVRAHDATGLDPHTVTAHVSHRVFELVYNTLVGLDSDLKVVPELAKLWEISDDGLQYTFYLYQGAKFHNRQELTSEDVKFTFQRILDPETGAVARSFFTDVEKITTPDDYTVVFKLSRPNAAFLVNLTAPNASIVSKQVATMGDLRKPENAIGTGAFKLTEWKPDEYMSLEKNTDFFIEGKPYLDEILIKIIPEEASILATLRAKEADFALLEDPIVAKATRQVSGVKLDSVPSLRYHLLFVNTSREPLDNQKVRQAISYAIGRQDLINTAVFGEGVPAGPIPPSMKLWALPTTEYPCYTSDVEKARQLLAEAGYPQGFETTILVPLGEPVTGAAEAQFIKAQLKEIGIKAELEITEFGIYVERWCDADLDLAIGLNAGAPDPDFYLYRYFHSTGSLQFITGDWNTPRLDDLLDQGRVESDLAQRQEIYAEAQRILVEGSPFIWTFVGFEYFAGQDYVKGFTPLATGSIEYLRDAWLDK